MSVLSRAIPTCAERFDLKTRTLAILILVVSVLSAAYTGFHLKQALDAEHELRSQMGDLSLATMSDARTSSSVVSTGENSLRSALESVRATGHHDEAWLAFEALGVLAGILMLRSAPRPA